MITVSQRPRVARSCTIKITFLFGTTLALYIALRDLVRYIKDFSWEIQIFKRILESTLKRYVYTTVIGAFL